MGLAVRLSRFLVVNRYSQFLGHLFWQANLNKKTLMLLLDVAISFSILSSCLSNMTGCGKCGISYTVINESETLQSIAKFCGLNITDIIQLNPSVGSSLAIEKGQTLNISCSGIDHFDCGPCGVRYVEEGNDSSYSISEKCGINYLYLEMSNPEGGVVDIPCGIKNIPTSLQCGLCGSSVHLLDGPILLQNVSSSCNVSSSEIQSLNPDVSTMIDNGTTIYLPCNNQSQDCGPCGASYKIQYGDTFDSISTKCRIPISLLAEANPQISNIFVIQTHQLLKIPCGLSFPFPTSDTKLRQPQLWFIYSVFFSLLVISSSCVQ
eukprot:c9137_g1_i2 orf=103-1062(-)